MYFLRMEDLHVIGASPEMLVRVSGDKLEYRPIAGTRQGSRIGTTASLGLAATTDSRGIVLRGGGVCSQNIASQTRSGCQFWCQLMLRSTAERCSRVFSEWRN